MDDIRVKAAPGVLVPKEGFPRKFINDAVAQTVAASAYYLRMVSTGDLVKVVESSNPSQCETTAKPRNKRRSING